MRRIKAGEKLEQVKLTADVLVLDKAEAADAELFFVYGPDPVGVPMAWPCIIHDHKRCYVAIEDRLPLVEVMAAPAGAATPKLADRLARQLVRSHCKRCAVSSGEDCDQCKANTLLLVFGATVLSEMIHDGLQCEVVTAHTGLMDMSLGQAPERCIKAVRGALEGKEGCVAVSPDGCLVEEGGWVVRVPGGDA